MYNRNNNNIGNFTGTIDQFLNHCSTLNVDEIEKRITEENNENNIIDNFDIINVQQLNEEIEKEILDVLILQQLKAEIDMLIEQGLVELAGKDEFGNDVYKNTDLGNSILNESKKKKNLGKRNNKKDK